MTYDDERAELEGYFNTNYVSTDIAWENVPYTPTPGTSWVRFTIQNGAADYVALQSIRKPGLITVQVFTPLEKGTNEARELADAILALFVGQRIATSILCRAGYINTVGARNGWHQVNVNINYWHDEVV